MINESRARTIILFIGDIVFFYTALSATLLIRYQPEKFLEGLSAHWRPFSFLFIFWLLIFYVNGLYNPQRFKNSVQTNQVFNLTLLINAALAITFFYLIPALRIAPKTNLFIFIAIFGLMDYWGRSFLNSLLTAFGFQNKLLLIGENNNAADLAEKIKENNQTGFQIGFWMKKGLKDKEFRHLHQIILADKINTVVIPNHLKKDLTSAGLLYSIMNSGVAITELASVYESVFQKIPLDELEEGWFLENITNYHRFFEYFKRIYDLTFSIIIGAVALPIAILIALLVKIISGGPVIYKQSRVGKNEKEFTIYKFRTMRLDAESTGAVWASVNDQRATFIGKILRQTHLDEIPQLYNILKGDLSFVGPRPERPEFIKELKKEIPYYEIRHLIKPGFTGWAQINYRYGASVEDAREKLQYDFYYIKNRSPFLDLTIMIKTIKFFFWNPK